jgi:hypothetical protein
VHAQAIARLVRLEAACSVRHSRGKVAQRKNQNTILPELSFHAVLGDGAREVRFGLSV